MLVINVEDSENNRWKRKAKQTKKKQTNKETERRKGVVQVRVKMWELNGFVARLS